MYMIISRGNGGKVKHKLLSCIILLVVLFLFMFFMSSKNSNNVQDVRAVDEKTKDYSNASLNHGFNVESVARKDNLLKFSGAKTEYNDEYILNAKREEVFEYSRAGNFANTRDVLRKALDSKIISEKEYYGELAHMLSISVSEPGKIVEEILKSGNQYGFEVMLSNLSGHDSLAASIDQRQKSEIFNNLAANKPVIEGYIGDLGLVDVYRYENWMGAMKTFSSSDANFVLNLNDLINNKITDPREVFGINALLYRDGYINKIDESARVKYQFYVDEYLRSYPRNKASSHIANGR